MRAQFVNASCTIREAESRRNDGGLSAVNWQGILQSIVGVPLSGDRLVRLTYLDEAGNSPNEGFLVVGGVLIDADRKLSGIENYFGILFAKAYSARGSSWLYLPRYRHLERRKMFQGSPKVATRKTPRNIGRLDCNTSKVRFAGHVRYC